MYLYRAGEESNPLRYAKKRLLAWVAQMEDPHERLTQVRLGSATGWRTELSFEDGEFRVGAFQVVYADGWDYLMGCGLSLTHPTRDDRLTPSIPRIVPRAGLWTGWCRWACLD